MLTSSYRSFQNSCAIETGLPDFHKMIVTVMKAYFQKQKPKVITYRDYKNFQKMIIDNKSLMNCYSLVMQMKYLLMFS